MSSIPHHDHPGGCRPRPNVRRPIRLGAAVLAIAGIAVSCTGGDDIAAPPVSIVLGDVELPTSFEDLDLPSPIDAVMGFSANEDPAHRSELERRAGLLTAECMLEAGFDYVPPTIGPSTPVVRVDAEPAYFSEAWVERYGFGVSTRRFRQSSVGPDLVGYVYTWQPDDDGPDDPNQAYMDSLSPGERDAYLGALYGGPQAVVDGEVHGPGNVGCLDAAFDEVFDYRTQARFYETFGDALIALQQRVEADPRFVDYRERVAHCVTAHGLRWSPGEDPNRRFGPRLDELGTPRPEDPFVLAGLDPETMTASEIEEFLADLEVLAPADLAILAEIQAEEIELARTVVSCGGGPLNEQYVLGVIRAEYEQRFLAEHADAMRAFRAS